jgi:hypothetical protein
MEWIDENTNIRITVIPGPKANQLESFEVIKPEGNLI